MAKEIQIIFVYDTHKSQEDDIIGPILYFHPAWVPDEQRAALCGQIVGTIQCMKSLFTKPDVISLNNGKFIIIDKGRFLFVMGTDKNTPSIFLQRRANSLKSVIEFFHKDFESLQFSCSNQKVSEKLHHTIDAYMKILMLSGKIFSEKPTLLLSKSSNDFFTQAVHILECCKSHNYVLGGVISYRNRSVATQLCPTLTQLLLVTEACRVSCPAKLIRPPINLPHEVQLYEVFISNDEHSKLSKVPPDKDIFQRLRSGDIKKISGRPSQKDNRSVLSAMKREQSLLFTSVPEEDLAAPPGFDDNYNISTTKKSRPRFLNLENAAPRNNTYKSLKQFSNLNSTSQIIVCNTPLQEPRKIVHFNPLSICHNQCVEDQPFLPDPAAENDKLMSSNATGLTRDAKSNNSKQYYYKTIADPSFPIFKRDGKPISRSFYEENETALAFQRNNKTMNRSSQELEKEDTDADFSPIKNNLLPLLYNKNAENSNSSSLSTNSTSVVRGMVKSTSFFDYISKGSNALDVKQSALSKSNFKFNYKPSAKTNDKLDSDEDSMEKCVLFRWHERDISLTLLVTLEICEEEDVLKSLCDICTNHLGKLDSKMRYNIESQNAQEREPYKFVVLDSTRSEALWNGISEDWRELHYFNEEFGTTTNVIEVLLRSSHTIYFGYRCGSNKIFYSEAMNCIGGLPLPADPMGVLQLKAKRRLERDYALILF